MRELGPWEKQWHKLMNDGYRQAEEKEYREQRYKREVKEEILRRKAKGSWWRQFLWDFRNPRI